MGHKTSFTSGSRPGRTGWAVAIALAVLAMVNTLVFCRLQTLALSDSIDECFMLQRQVALFEPKRDVRVLILGNSHGLADFRPLRLASALGVANRRLFNLSLPGGTPHEMRLVATRYAPRFPNARLAICAVDPMYFDADSTYRLRLWTRTSPAERWNSAAPTLDARIARVARMLFPIADDLTPIKMALLAHPRQVLSNAISPNPRPSRYFDAMCDIAYPWGFPPVWNDPAIYQRGLLDRLRQNPWFLSTRLAQLAPDKLRLAEQAPELSALAHYLESRGITVVFVETPYADRLERAVRHLPQYGAYRRTVANLMASTGHVLEVPPPNWSLEDFYDFDHLNDRGARAMAKWLVRKNATALRSALSSPTVAEPAP